MAQWVNLVNGDAGGFAKTFVSVLGGTHEYPATVRTIVWFRQDLRLADNPALSHAAAQGEVVPVFIWAPGEEGDWPPGAASRWWMHQSLAALDADLRRLGSRLVIRRRRTPVPAGRDELRRRRLEPALRAGCDRP